MIRRPVRAAVSLVAALALATTLAACGGGSTPSAAGGGPWSFTDDLGRTVTLDETPTRIAGYSDVLGSLWSYGITPVASFGQAAMADEPGYAGKDVGAVTEVGRAYGEINLEALAAARPQLIAVTHYPTARGAALDPDGLYYGFKDTAQQESVAKIAPIVVIGVSGTATEVMDRVVDLAVSLGADRDSGVISRARADYAVAADRLEQAAAAGLTVSAIAGYADEGVYIARYQDDPVLLSYQELGVSIPALEGDNYYWLNTSWENIGRYPTDVVLYSERAMGAAELTAQAGFSQTPAAMQQQLHPWAVVAFDYVAQARDVDQLAGWLEASRKVT